MAPKKKVIDERKLTYVGTVTYPDIEKDVLHRYKKFRYIDNRYYVKCDEIVLDSKGNQCKCNLDYQREDNYKIWLTKNVHICEPGNPVNQLTLHDFEKNINQEDLHNISENSLYRDMALFTGKKNLSLDLLTSDEFHSLAISFITYGLEIAGDRHAEEKALKSFNKIKRDKLRYIMTTEAFKHHRRMLHRFSKVPYTCIAMDEGKTSGHNNLHFVLECPQSDLKSYPYKIACMKGGNTKCYLESIPEGFIPLNIANISVGSVVIDGNTAQKKAWESTSLITDTNIPNADKFIIVPCLCHRVHNSYKRVAEHNADLAGIVQELHRLSKLCIEKQREIGSVCPQHMNTRWANDYDVVKFLIDHQDKILKIEPKMPINDFTELEKVLRVYKCLISRFENPKTLFSTAFQILERAIYCLYELGSKYHVPFGRELSESLSKYTLESKDGGIWPLAYTFTPQGREDFRKRIIENCNPREQTYLHYFNLEDYPQFNEVINTQILEVNMPQEEEILMTNDGEIATNLNEESSDENTDSNDEFDSDDSDDSEILPENSQLFNQNHLVAAKNYLNIIIKRRKLTMIQKEKSIEAYNSYIDSPEDPYKGYHVLKNSEYSWLQIRSAFSEMQIIADIAMRLLSAALSEASCERAISKQRLIHTNRRMRSNPDLLDARRILQSI